MAQYNYKANPYPTPGVRAYAFQMYALLPAYDLDGPGFPPARQLRCVGPVQSFQQQSVPLIGLLGTVSGQMALAAILGAPGQANS